MIWSVVHFVITFGHFGAFIMPLRPHLTSNQYSLKVKFLQYVKKMFETNKGNFSGSKPIIGKIITFNPEELELLVSNNVVGTVEF
jgi:hypothetical protein